MKPSQFIEEACNDLLFPPPALPERRDHFRRNENAAGCHPLSPPAAHSGFQSSSVVQLAGFLSSIRWAMSVRQAGSCRSRKCSRKAANSFCCAAGRLATARINSAMLMALTYRFARRSASLVHVETAIRELPPKQ